MFTTRHEWLLIRPRDVLVSKPLLGSETSSQPDYDDDASNADMGLMIMVDNAMKIMLTHKTRVIAFASIGNILSARL